MTSEQLNRALKLLGLNQSKLARLLGVNPRTVRRWVLGETPPHPPVVTAIKTWLVQGIPAQMLVNNGGFDVEHAIEIAQKRDEQPA